MRKLCVLLGVLSLSVASPAAATRRQIQWQRSESPSVRLGVRDKNADLGSYDATFVVTAERSGKSYEKKVSVAGDNFGKVDFPADFAAYDWMQHGTRFNWTCTVGGQVVVRGKFVLATTLELEPEVKRGAGRQRRRR